MIAQSRLRGTGMFMVVGLLSACVPRSEYGQLEKKLDQSLSEKEKAEKEATTLARRLNESRANLQAIEDQKATQTSLIDSLRKELMEGNIKITRMMDRITVSVLDKVLFDSGEAEIKPSGREALDRVSEVLRKTVDKDILIYGHTDNVPIGPSLQDKFLSNWELSTARATSVVRYLAENHVPQEKMLAAGQSQFQPVAPNETPEGRQQNRRIEIVLIPREITKTAP